MPTKTPIDHSPLDPNDRRPESSNEAPEFPSGKGSGSASASGGRPITASEIICTTVYQFPELSDAAKDKARTWYRELGPHDDWWDAVYEDFERVCEILGIRLKTTPVRLMGGGTRGKPCIWFSGFWSQGDGAYFEGYVSDWPKFLATLGKEDWAFWAHECNWTASSTHSYGNNMSINSELEAPENPHDEEEDPLRFHAWNIAYLPPSEADLAALESEIEDEFNRLASGLYNDLEMEHDYLTDDEQVVDWILSNLDDEKLIVEEVEEFFAD